MDCKVKDLGKGDSLNPVIHSVIIRDSYTNKNKIYKNVLNEYLMDLLWILCQLLCRLINYPTESSQLPIWSIQFTFLIIKGLSCKIS